MLNKKVLLFGIIISFLLLSAFWLFKPEVCTATSPSTCYRELPEPFGWPTYHKFINDSNYSITISRSYIAYNKEFIYYKDASGASATSSEHYEIQTAEEKALVQLDHQQDATVGALVWKDVYPLFKLRFVVC